MAPDLLSGVLVYGATGYTGHLVAKKVKEVGLRATLAGRNAEKVKAIANEVQLPYEVFDLSDSAKLDNSVGRHAVVLHIAGPYTYTARPMVDACLRKKAHYIDVTGELRVVEAVQQHDEEAKASGVTLMPAIGYDASAGDCLAAHLKKRLPTATHLDLGLFVPRFAGSYRPRSLMFSRGTLKSFLVGILANGGVVRRDGKLVYEALGARCRTFDLGEGGHAPFVSFAGSELIAAHHSTGIPNITTYIYSALSFPTNRVFTGLLSSRAFQSVAQFAIDKILPRGPAEIDAEAIRAGAVGEARDEKSGKIVRTFATSGSGYPFTAKMAVEVTRQILNGNFKPRFQTVASAYGPEFLLSIPGVKFEDLPGS
ncbi:hypothetical protein CBR_g38908 [Chara braunii]|uniref:Saccharopine dehydrogenase NADP binding domain-containing protein n=1 Tax=Chara braunii TaxID=69332 RepID=A0A388LQM0_CHABU|nr:hypothetical protein CBR_g38908 [Chara braunii]|eukprot:GBG84626.1 hypothetical protein CBR_g38908 [Chara braunii]